ncbi:hypothetical protein NLX67_15930 [Domibacillus sp. A3M-37]|uniref:hypothetical protein n=1 Tax=Domibacillus sp. A3M-37 TaxID=2962037 RepID=UPI0020B680CA|nr:hypothetical protein [Domibacillus sp. A3M-37]MCP3763861.1 hypothetical protein [Domibacillus sp. A3M-37]
MNRSNAYQLLKTHYENTGKVMSAIELIVELTVSYGKTDAAEIMAGRRMFDTYLSTQGGKTA